MKLLTQTSLYMVTLSLFLFFACGVAFYFVFKTYTNQALDNDLDQERQEVVKNTKQYLAAAEDGFPFFNQIEFIPVSKYVPEAISYFDSLVQTGDQQKAVPSRFVRFYAKSDDKTYEVKIFKSKISSDDLTVRITGLITLLALFFTIGIFLLNQYGFKQTWKGFWTSLQKVQGFKAGSIPPEFEPTEIDEFNTLNEELQKMTQRISRDYHNLESFTSHTTHEFQTPLAVIRSKVEILMQSENLTEDQFREIQNIDSYAGQLSRLSHSLSLLFKIENQQFGGEEIVDLSKLLENHLEFLNDQSEMRGITTNISIEKSVKVTINSSLADILIQNLIRNSIFHNIPGGKIDLELVPGKLVLSNSGNPIEADPEKIFGEFVKGKKSNGLGLGLSIARRICEQYGIGLNYEYNSNIHSFILSFP